LEKKGLRDFELEERDRKAQTLAELLELGSTQPQYAGGMISGEEGPQPASMERGYPAPEDLDPSLATRAGKYGLLDFYLNLRKSTQPDYKISDGSIIRFPAEGGTPGIVGQLPEREKAKDAEKRAFMDMYQSFIMSGMSPQDAFERSMIHKEAGKKDVEGVKQSGATGRTEIQAESNEKIAKMNNDTKRFVASLAANAKRYAADKVAGRSGRVVDEVIMSYPGLMGSSLTQRHYKFDPAKPETIEQAVNSIDTRLSALDAMANTSAAKRKFKWTDFSTYGAAFDDDSAKEYWAEFVKQFAPGHEPTDDDLKIEDMPGDLRFMAQEYVNLKTLKDHIGENYGFIPAEEEQPSGGGEEGGDEFSVADKRAAILQFAADQGQDTSSVVEATDDEITRAYELLLQEQGEAVPEEE
jgi:hypothetical protein